MKKFLIFLLSLAVVSVPIAVFAFTGKKAIDPITPGIPSIPVFIKQVLGIVMKIGIPISALFIIWAGFLFVTAQGDTSQLTRAKSAIVWAVIGAAVALGAWMIATAIEGTISNIGGGSVTSGGSTSGGTSSVNVNLSASNVSSSQATISWPAATSGSVAGYHVYQNGVFLTDVSGTSYNVSDLAPSTNYTYSVAPYDYSGNLLSEAVSIAVTTLAVGAVVALAGNGSIDPPVFSSAVPSPSQVALSWYQVDEASSYNLYRNGTLIARTSGLSYIDTNVTPSMTYNYTLYAYNNSGNASLQSLSKTVTIPAEGETTLSDRSSPTAPTNVRVTQSDGQVRLVWSASTDDIGIDEYAVYRNGTQIGRTSSLSYLDASVSSGLHTYYIAAYDMSGKRSEPSVLVNINVPVTASDTSGTTSEGTTVPVSNSTLSAPTGLEAYPAPYPDGAYEIDLSWDIPPANAGIIGYEVYRDGTKIGTTGETAYADMNPALDPAKSYDYAVAAFDQNEALGPKSAVVSMSPLDISPPTPPSYVKAGTITSDSIALSWTASLDNVGVTGYTVFRNGIKASTTPLISFIDKGLNASTTYSYLVFASDFAGNMSDGSAPFAATTAQ